MSKNILVVDDEKDISDFIKKILERSGYKVDAVSDGIMAKELLEKKEFDKIFLDCSLPGISGLELIKIAREKNPTSKIIVFSGCPVVDGKLVNDLGANEFLQKPVSQEKIEEILGI